MPTYEYRCPHCQAVTPLVVHAGGNGPAPTPAREPRAAGAAGQVAPPGKAKQRIARWTFIAYLAFIAAVVIWTLLAVSYGIAPGCAAGSDWVRGPCFLLPMWRFFA